MRTGQGEWKREGATLVEEMEVEKFPSLKQPSVHRVIKTYTQYIQGYFEHRQQHRSKMAKLSRLNGLKK